MPVYVPEFLSGNYGKRLDWDCLKSSANNVKSKINGKYFGQKVPQNNILLQNCVFELTRCV